MTITKTIGPGGDYSDYGIAMNAFDGQALTEDLIFNQIGDVNNITKVTLALGGFSASGISITFNNPDKYTTYLNKVGSNQCIINIQISGTFNISYNDLIIENVSVDSNTALIYSNPSGSIATNNARVINYYNLLVNGSNKNCIGLSIDNDGLYNLVNCVVCNCNSNGVVVVGNTSSTLNYTSKFLENCTIFNCGLVSLGLTSAGIYIHNWNLLYRCYCSLKNVVVFNNGSYRDFAYDYTPVNDLDFINCADSDDTISSSGSTISNCITGITTDDFIEYDNPYRYDFLNINTSSDLYGVGTTSISNTADIYGLPRPNQFGLVCIGAHEADNRFNFVGDPRSTKVTKPVNFELQGITQSNYSYSWSLGDSLTSTNQNPTTTYTVPGYKTISLTVNDGFGNDGTVTKNDYINIEGITVPTKDKTVYPFKMKIGSVNHHLLTEKGNTFYEDYGVVVEGWSYVNIGKADEINWVRVKFIVPANEKIKYYLWDFGDGATLKTINREISHKYDLTTRADWMTSTGVIPGIDYSNRFSGRWTYVQLTAVSLDNRVADSVSRYPVCIYEIIPQSESEIYFEDGEIIIPEGEVILS